MKKQITNVLAAIMLLSVSNLWGQNNNEHGTGAIPISPEEYAKLPRPDWEYMRQNSPFKGTVQPRTSSKFLTSPPIYDQGQQGSCVSNAYACALSILLYYNIYNDMRKSKRSAAFIYNMYVGGNCSLGIPLPFASRYVIDSGICADSLMPYNQYDCSTQPNSAAIADAKNNRAARSYWLNTGLGISVKDIKSTIDLGYPIIAGISTENWHFNSSYVLQNYSTNLNHAVCIIGYDDNKAGGAFKVQNSWGSAWEDNGCYWIPYSLVYSILQMNVLCPSNYTAPFLEDGGIYMLSPKSAPSRRLNVYNADTSNGTSVNIYSENIRYEQLWRAKHLGNNVYTFESYNATGKYLDNPGSSNNTDIWKDTGSSGSPQNNIQWQLVILGNEYYTLENKAASGYYLNVTNNYNYDNAGVGLATSTSADNQKWKLIPVPIGKNIALYSLSTKKYVSYSTGFLYADSPTISEKQIFKLETAGSGYVALRATSGSLTSTWSDYAYEPCVCGRTVKRPDEKYQILTNSDGSFSIISVGSTYYFSVLSQSTGYIIQAYTSGVYGNSEKFQFVTDIPALSPKPNTRPDNTPILEIKAYPNPSAGVFFVDLKPEQVNAVVQVYDINGKLLLKNSDNTPARKIDLSGTHGLLLIRATIGSETIATGKVFVQ